jgi:phosphatidylserine/phosphatidylglycerophosphate/cardiolipin synthase-like enzyme
MDLGQDRCYLSAHVAREEISYEGDIMHDKFVVVDGRYVWTGSTNASDSCSGGYNSNLVLSIDSPTVAGYFTTEFEQMYAGRFHGQKEAQAQPMRAQISNDVAVEVFFSPQHHPLTKAVLPLIVEAREQIDIGVFFLTHKEIAQALIDAKNRGVRIRVIMDATGAKNEYTKHEVLRLAGIPVKVEDLGGKMHAKSAVIDHRIVVGGSMNWTNAGNDDNDENTIIVYSSKHAAQYDAWFQAMWDAIPDKWLQANPDPESKDSGTACTDQTDNDFDDLDDAADPGCGANPPPMSPLPPYRIVPMGGQKCSWELVNPEPEK